ncbi:MAG: tetratricopeptide repeat protein [Rhodobacteraceae bacterium]|nr:tetratricopeptide repeat protein [Paracoccaceae bacterium]
MTSSDTQPLDLVFDRAISHHERGEFEAAKALYRQVLDHAPDHIQAWLYLGLAATQQENFSEAENWFARALERDPNNLAALIDRAGALIQLKRYDESIALSSRALEIDPGNILALGRRAAATLNGSRPDQALPDLDRLIALNPNDVDGLCNRGLCHLKLGNPGLALPDLDRTLHLVPSHRNAQLGRAAALLDLQRTHEALTFLTDYVTQHPSDPEAAALMATILIALRRLNDAILLCDRILSADPGQTQAYVNRAHAHRHKFQYQAALTDYEHALTLDPTDVETMAARAYLLLEMRRFDSAIDAFEAVNAAAPEYPFIMGDLVGTRLQCCDWRDYGKAIEFLKDGVRNRKRAATPFQFTIAVDDPHLARQCAEIYARHTIKVTEPRTRKKIERPPSARIKIAYVSADFREHAASYLIAGLFEKHDRRRFEIFGISCGRPDNSPMRKRITEACDRFVDAADWDDEKLRTYIRNSGIDITVDMTGNTHSGRTALFALDTGSVHVNYLGYPGTMGHPAYDYMIADRYIVSDEMKTAFSEHMIRLPDTYQVNDGQRIRPQKTTTRANHGLPQEGFVFCCFNNCSKITPPIFDIWMELLQTVDQSVLWLLEDTETAKSNLRNEATARGVESRRLIFAPKVPQAEHLERHHHADLFLDTLPCNAHTTASDALWMGLPLITCSGAGFASRVAGSLLHALGVPELSVPSMRDYRRLAVNLASTPNAMHAVRSQIEQSRMFAPLFDTDRFRRNIELAYERMYDLHVRGLPPNDFDIAPEPPQ